MFPLIFLIPVAIGVGFVLLKKAPKCDDPTLDKKECKAVENALKKETDGKKLRSFAGVMMPDHKRAAAALNARGILLQGGRIHGETSCDPNGVDIGWDLGPISVPKFIPNPADAVKAIGDFAPIAWLGDRAKDFANTDFGHTVLQAIGSAAYVSLAPILGPQLASVGFALPGVIKGDSFDKAYVGELAYRIKTTADILTAGQGGEALGSSFEQIANSLGSQYQSAMTQIGDILKQSGIDPSRAGDLGRNLIDKLDFNASDLQNTAKRLGIREDVAQMAIDGFRRAGSSFAPSPGHLGRQFDPKTGKLIVPPSAEDKLYAASMARVSRIGLPGIVGLSFASKLQQSMIARAKQMMPPQLWATAADVGTAMLKKMSDDQVRDVLGFRKPIPPTPKDTRAKVKTNAEIAAAARNARVAWVEYYSNI